MSKLSHILVIPSKDRLDTLEKYKDLPVYRFNHSSLNTLLWVSAKEQKNYAEFCDKHNLNHITTYGDEKSTNIAETREEILKFCVRNKLDYLFMVDDDVRFFDRESGFKSVPLDENSNVKMVNHLLSLCTPMHPLVSLHDRFMINQVKYAFIKNCKIMRLYMIHIPTFIKNNISFLYKNIKVFEDKLVQCLLNERGIRTLTSTIYAQSTRDSSNANGGCAEYRTNSETERCVDIFLKDFPKAFLPAMKTGYAHGPVRYVKSTLKKYLNPGGIVLRTYTGYVRKLSFRLSNRGE